MSSSLLPVHTASVEFVEICTDQGLPVLIPVTALKRLQQTGQTTIDVTLCIAGDIAQPENSLDNNETMAVENWISQKDAATLHLEDIDGLTRGASISRVRRGITLGKFVSKKFGRSRLIDPVSFAAWRLSEREKNLSKLDKNE